MNNSDGTLVSKKYTDFRGVDFTSDETQVALFRSPNALNVWKDYNSSLGQAIETRMGFRIIKQFKSFENLGVDYKTEIVNIHAFKLSERPFFAVHTKHFDGTNYIAKLWWWKNYPDEKDCEFTLLRDNIGQGESRGFLFLQKYYILDNKEYIALFFEEDELVCKAVKDIAYVPTVALVDREGNRSEYQDYNLLTGRQKVQFAGNAGKKDYTLYPALADRSVYDLKIFINDEEKTETTHYSFVNYKTVDGVLSPDSFKISFVTEPKDNDVIVASFEQAFASNRQKRSFQGDGVKKEFDLSPSFPPSERTIDDLRLIYGDGLPSYALSGEKVVFTDPPLNTIVFAFQFEQYITDSKKIEQEIDNCAHPITFDNRAFFFGGKKANKFFFSARDDAEYFPAYNFEYAGVEDMEVAALINMSESFAVIKKGQGQSNYLFNVSGISTGDEIMPKAYRATLISSSVGGYGGLNYLNDVIFLSPQGLKRITRLDLHNERNVENKSNYVDGRLVNEQRLSHAKMTVWKGYLIIMVGGRCYLADKRQESGGQYEWYFWDNIGVYEKGDFFEGTEIVEFDGRLFFGTKNGCICVFNSDYLKVRDDGVTPLGTGELVSDAYSDMGVDSEFPIISFWSTPVDDFGSRNRFKRCNKRGAMADLKSFAHSVCKIAFKTNYFEYQELKRHNGGYFDFSDMDFSDFTFNTNDKNVFYFKPKAKKWERISIKFYSDELKKPFGVFGVNIEAYLMGYAKEKNR